MENLLTVVSKSPQPLITIER